ncbi:hypothetical protein Agabi119p4_7962 [Agaricus bisporus var. burnettii]|uniref:Uncharacterized protein n=1 Tax=Agaricus bisporus var. burnettii TaxID=192524 RepID=A0A8H7EY30_AGABI|nr:hypothetical protein Agabi119p4_7962 [Agaricus bisporus var. burnettii]
MTDQPPATKKIIAIWPEWSATREYTVGAHASTPKFFVTALGWEVTRRVAQDFDLPFDNSNFASIQDLEIQLFPPLPPQATLSDLPDEMPLIALVSPPQSITNDVKQRIHNQRGGMSEMRNMMLEMQQAMKWQNEKIGELQKTNGQHDKKLEEMRKTMSGQYDKKMEEMRKTINGQNKTINGQNKRMEEMKKTINEKERQMEDMRCQNEKAVNSLKKDLEDVKRNMATLQASYEGLQHSVSFLHLRYLLDEARIKVATDLGESWDSLHQICKEKSYDLAGYLHSRLANSSFPLPKNSIHLICYPNSIRDQGNYAAHNATEDQVHLAITKVEAQDKRVALATLYEYVFQNRIVV